MINSILQVCQTKKAAQRKVTVHQLQSICGFLNFLGRVIILGRAFTRRLYAPLQMSKAKLKPHYHVRITNKMQADFKMWKAFLLDQTAFCRPFEDFNDRILAEDIDFAMDASKNSTLGFGGHCGTNWMQAKWGRFIETCNPSIQFLELYALNARV